VIAGLAEYAAWTWLGDITVIILAMWNKRGLGETNITFVSQRVDI